MPRERVERSREIFSKRGRFALSRAASRLSRAPMPKNLGSQMRRNVARTTPNGMRV